MSTGLSLRKVLVASRNAGLVRKAASAGVPCDALVPLVTGAVQHGDAEMEASIVGRWAGALAESGCAEGATELVLTGLPPARAAGLLSIVVLLGDAAESLRRIDDGETLAAVCETLLELDRWLYDDTSDPQ